MAVNIVIPSVGESVTEAVLAEWYVKDGDTVKKDDPVLVIETDKVTLEINAEASGVVRIQVEADETVEIGATVGIIEEMEESAADVGDKKEPEVKEEKKEKAAQPAEETKKEKKQPEKATEKPIPVKHEEGDMVLSPSVRRLLSLHDVDVSAVTATGPGGRLTKGDVLLYLESGKAVVKAGDAKPAPAGPDKKEDVVRKTMTPIRRKIAARLLEAKQNTAMLTTFNEIDMTKSMEIRSRYKEDFKKKFDVNLGFMSFFVKATVDALKMFPQLNAYIDGNDIVYHNYHHIGMAVGSPKGLVVPVIRNANDLSFFEIEKAIVNFVVKIKNNKLDISDMEGGTFTITNGGVFGSLLSTPILNPPQSGILGLHKIEKRPVVVNDEIVIRSMMYVAMSYDHRIVDGREAVTFLKRIKECIEDPERLLMEI